MKESPWKTLLSIGAESGTVELKAKHTENGGRAFRKTITEMDEGNRLISEEGKHEDGLELLNDYAWLSLYPLYVDEEMKASVQRKILTHSYRNESAFFAWAEACFPKTDPELVMAANWICTSKNTVILTGAGMSTESQLPDFRSKTGWWREIDPVTVASPQALEDDYDLFQSFYAARLEALHHAQPHAGHKVIAEWESKRLISAVATQNVDGLHSEAGSRKVYELHGSLKEIMCHSCGTKAKEDQFINKEKCEKCGGRLRPDVILFGEMLPQKAWNASLHYLETAQLVIVIGSSLEVYPANQLAGMSNGRTVYINDDLSGGAMDFNLVLEGKAGEILKQLNELINTVS